MTLKSDNEYLSTNLRDDEEETSYAFGYLCNFGKDGNILEKIRQETTLSKKEFLSDFLIKIGLS